MPWAQINAWLIASAMVPEPAAATAGAKATATATLLPLRRFASTTCHLLTPSGTTVTCMTAILTGAEGMIPKISTLSSNVASAKTLLPMKPRNGTTPMAQTTGRTTNGTTPSRANASTTSHLLTLSATIATSTTTTLTGAVATIPQPSILTPSAACAKLRNPTLIQMHTWTKPA